MSEVPNNLEKILYHYEVSFDLIKAIGKTK